MGTTRVFPQEVIDLHGTLTKAWAKAEPKHNVTLYPAGFSETFLDMARAVHEVHIEPRTITEIYEQRFATLRTLHREEQFGDCVEDGEPFPCRTIQILDFTPSTGIEGEPR